MNRGAWLRSIGLQRMGHNWSDWACTHRSKVEVSMPRISVFTCCPLLRKDNLELTMLHLECAQRNNNSKMQNKGFTAGIYSHMVRVGYISMWKCCFCVWRWAEVSGVGSEAEKTCDVAGGKSKAETTRTSWSPHRSHPLLASNLTHGGDAPQTQHVLLAWRSQTPNAAIQQKWVAAAPLCCTQDHLAQVYPTYLASTWRLLHFLFAHSCRVLNQELCRTGYNEPCSQIEHHLQATRRSVNVIKVEICYPSLHF